MSTSCFVVEMTIKRYIQKLSNAFHPFKPTARTFLHRFATPWLTSQFSQRAVQIPYGFGMSSSFDQRKNTSLGLGIRLEGLKANKVRPTEQPATRRRYSSSSCKKPTAQLQTN